MEFDPADLVIDVAINDNAGWREFNCDIIEDDLSNMLEPLGKPVTIVIFFYADHAGNIVTRRSHTEILIFVQNALIIADGKR